MHHPVASSPLRRFARFSVVAAAIGAVVLGCATASYAATDTVPPSKPGKVVASEVVGTTFTFSWAPCTDNVGVVRYRIDILTGDVIRSYYTPTNTLTMTDGRPSKSYYLNLTASDAAGNSASSGFQFVTLPPGDHTPPTPPTNLRISGVTSTQFQITWDPGKDDNGIWAYEILRLTPIPEPTLLLMVPSIPFQTWTVSRLSPATTYVIAVRTIDAAGNRSGLSQSVTVVTP